VVQKIAGATAASQKIVRPYYVKAQVSEVNNRPRHPRRDGVNRLKELVSIQLHANSGLAMERLYFHHYLSNRLQCQLAK
jgi:hypothetical protein